ncbi:MAG: hypothetical protein M0C28_17595 [Candidatus Moduliflexus flocculans]|nr:hypothetical protein [Candidatus Moduliflexus flocculans]
MNGNLVKVSDRTDAAKTRTFISNAQGQIVEKTDWQGKPPVLQLRQRPGDRLARRPHGCRLRLQLHAR